MRIEACQAHKLWQMYLAGGQEAEPLELVRFCLGPDTGCPCLGCGPHPERSHTPPAVRPLFHALHVGCQNSLKLMLSKAGVAIYDA